MGAAGLFVTDLTMRLLFSPSAVLSLCVFRNNLGWLTRSLLPDISYQTAGFSIFLFISY